FVEAMRWYRLAAAQENAGAQYVLGRMYYEGEGVPKDCAEAMNWFEKSALQKDIDAMFALGREYGESNVFPKNEAEAYAWYSMVKLYAEEELYPDEEEHNYNDELSSSLASLDRLNSSFSPEQMSAAQKRVAELQKEIEVIELARPV
ncbi:sel1 repeat family protein, partial [Mariniblastus sp.]|nr:sel1 repeat family protein [Mariniblastus sp.]